MPENSWPPQVDHIVNFIAFLSSKGLSYSTAKCYLAGVSFHLQISGFSDPTKFFVVRKMLEGLRRSNPSKDVRSPITFPLLKRIVKVLQTICTNKYEYCLFSSAFLLAYFALLRVGEITVSNKNGPDRVIGINDIEINASGTVKIRIRMSKTDQLGFGTNIEITPSEESVILNELLSEYLRVRPNFQGPLFCHFDGKFLTAYQFAQMLKKCISQLGIDTNTFKSHSLRIGCATYMYIKGKSEQNIREKGRWKSDAYKSYIRI